MAKLSPLSKQKYVALTDKLKEIQQQQVGGLKRSYLWYGKGDSEGLEPYLCFFRGSAPATVGKLNIHVVKSLCGQYSRIAVPHFLFVLYNTSRTCDGSHLTVLLRQFWL